MGRRPRNSTRKSPPRKRIPSGRAPTAPKKATRATVANVAALSELLAVRWPAVRVELDHQNAYQLLVATMLAAQSTDKQINLLTPALFEKYPDPPALAVADQLELEKL